MLDGFQGYVENNCQKNIAAVFRKDKMSASEVLADLLKVISRRSSVFLL